MAGPYFLDDANGNDVSDGLSEGNAWQTFEKAMATVAAGEKVWVQSGTDYDTQDGATGAVGQIQTVGTATAPIVFEAYTTTTGDNGQATVNATTNTLTNCINSLATGDRFYVFKNIIFTGGSGDCIELNNCNRCTFKNCRMTGATGKGIDNGTLCRFEACEVDANGGGGIISSQLDFLVACSIHGNTGVGHQVIGGHGIAFCEFYNNSGHDHRDYATNGFPAPVISCTFDGENTNSKSLIAFNGGGTPLPDGVINCILFDAGVTTSHGITSTADNGELVIDRNNLFFNNTSDRDKWLTGEGNVEADPSFTSEAGDDYTLQSGSPAKAAGIDAGEVVNGVSYTDIGAHQRQEAGGGGGGVIHRIPKIIGA